MTVAQEQARLGRAVTARTAGSVTARVLDLVQRAGTAPTADPIVTAAAGRVVEVAESRRVLPSVGVLLAALDRAGLELEADMVAAAHARILAAG